MSATLENEDVLKLAAGRKIGRRQRMRRALLAHLIGGRAEGEDEDYEGEEGQGEAGERESRGTADRHGGLAGVRYAFVDELSRNYGLPQSWPSQESAANQRRQRRGHP